MESVYRHDVLDDGFGKTQAEFVSTLKKWIKKTAFRGGFALLSESFQIDKSSCSMTDETLAMICGQLKAACYNIFERMYAIERKRKTEEDYEDEDDDSEEFNDYIPESSMLEAINQSYSFDMNPFSNLFLPVPNGRLTDEEEGIWNNLPISHFCYLWCLEIRGRTLYMRARTLSILNVFMERQLLWLFSKEQESIFSAPSLRVACLSSVCSACERADTMKKKCSGCFNAMYCSSACQKEHWKEHKHLCREMKTDVLLVARTPEDNNLD